MSDGPSDDEFVELTTQAPPGDNATIDHVADDDAGKDSDAEKEAGKGDKEAGAEQEAEAGDDTGEDGEGDGEKDEALRDKRGRFKGGAEGRIAELTRHKHDALRRAEAAEAEVARLKGNATQNGALPGSDAAKPNPDDFEDYGEYVEALTDWKADRREAQRADKAATSAAEEAANARNAEWSAKVAATTAVLPDYEEVAGKSDIQVRDHVVDAIMDADRGPELVYHLAQNPDVAERLNAMSPARAAIELGKIEASLGEAAAPAKAEPPAKKTTTAPAPITPVKPGATTAKDPAKMSQDEYNEWRKGQLGR